MPPLRFKAVCTETGREFFPESQGLQSGPDMRVSELKKRKGKVLHHWPLQVWVPAEYTNRLQLCQSTGLTDSRGVEVFEGDVLYDIYAFEIGDEDIIGNMRIIEFDGIGFDFFCYFDSSRDDGYKDFHRYLSHHVVIGNRWQPAEELKARAEALIASNSG